MSAQGSTIDPACGVDEYERGSWMTTFRKRDLQGPEFSFIFLDFISQFLANILLLLASYFHIMLYCNNVYSCVVQISNHTKDLSNTS